MTDVGLGAAVVVEDDASGNPALDGKRRLVGSQFVTSGVSNDVSGKGLSVGNALLMGANVFVRANARGAVDPELRTEAAAGAGAAKGKVGDETGTDTEIVDS